MNTIISHRERISPGRIEQDFVIPKRADRRTTNQLTSYFSTYYDSRAIRHTNPTIEDLNIFFSEPKNIPIILDGIDYIWKKDLLFHDKKIQSYILEELKQIAYENAGSLSLILNPNNHKKRKSFLSEYLELLEHSDLSTNKKLIACTQALELALLGGNPTEVIRQINLNGQGSKGFRNELLAGWTVAKFILGAKYCTDHEITQSLNFPTSHSNDKQGISKRKEAFIREIDIFSKGIIGSVKSNDNDFVSQILDIFFVLYDSVKANRIENLDYKISLLRTASKPEQLSTDYNKSEEYADNLDKAIKSAISIIEKFYPKENREEDLSNAIDKLITKKNVEVHYLPYIGNGSSDTTEDWTSAFMGWIKRHYDAKSALTT